MSSPGPECWEQHLPAAPAPSCESFANSVDGTFLRVAILALTPVTLSFSGVDFLQLKVVKDLLAGGVTERDDHVDFVVLQVSRDKPLDKSVR